MALYFSSISNKELELSSEFLKIGANKKLLDKFFAHISKIKAILEKLTISKKDFRVLSKLDNELAGELFQIELIMKNSIEADESFEEFQKTYQYLDAELTNITNYFKQSYGIEKGLFISYTKYLFSYESKNRKFVQVMSKLIPDVMQNKIANQALDMEMYFNGETFTLPISEPNDFDFVYLYHKLNCSIGALPIAQKVATDDILEQLLVFACTAMIPDFVASKEAKSYIRRNPVIGAKIEESYATMRETVRSTLMKNLAAN